MFNRATFQKLLGSTDSDFLQAQHLFAIPEKMIFFSGLHTSLSAFLTDP